MIDEEIKKQNRIIEKVKIYILIAIISFILCIPLFSKNYNITFDDGIQHLCRIIGTFQTIEEGQPFGSIMSEFCNGFGYSWNLFYSPITAYRTINF